MLVEDRVDESLQEGPDSVGQRHQDVGRPEPEHVVQKVAGQLPILTVVVGVDHDAAEGDEEQHQKRQRNQALASQVEAERSVERSEAQEAEELHVAHDQHFEQHPPERVGPKELADLVFEQAVEHPVEEHHQDDCDGHEEDEVVVGAVDEEVVFSLLFQILRIAVHVVLVDHLDRVFQIVFDLF